ncbi:DMP19 family protein [Rufibacter roseolus]|uniref:DMP19 family protein n=1 Tax=Rufibacter roseolus TaxID=2817375 RepID=UPI001B30B56B|nr:DMP19 family protein [Rufibacter roseolus]
MNTKPNLEQLLEAEDTNSSIIKLDDYICKLCSWGEKMDALSQPQKLFFFNQNLEREINNGGFNQFYYNSSGDFAHQTVESLNAIGADKTAEILKKANGQFPNQTVPKDRAERQEIVEQIEEEANVVWEELDQQFFDYEDDLNSLNLEFVRKNKSFF